MKKIVILLILVSIMGCSNNSKKDTSQVNNEKSSKNEIAQTNEFIDIDNQTVKFLFRTIKGSKISFYAGENVNALKLIKEEENYDYLNGFKVDGFIPGKIYFYKIVAEFEREKIESKIESFAKINRTNLNPKAKWAKNSVFYEIYIRSFYDSNGDGIGDFKGVEQKLDYIKDLGIDAVWLMPMMDAQTDHGYDVVDYYKVETDYGTMEDFQKLINSAHSKGIKIILDLVINHCSWDNKWVDKFVAGETPYKDYFSLDDEKDIFGSFSCADLNYRSPKLREEIKNMTKFWIDKGVDGFRLDAAKHIDEEDMEVTHNWWQEFNEYCKEVNPDTYIVGESWYETNEETAPFFKDTDSSFNFPLMEDLVKLMKGKNVDIIDDVNKYREVYRKVSTDYTDATFLSNHDAGRISGKVKPENLKLVTSLFLTLPGTPFLLYGDEIGQSGTNEDSARAPFDWYTSSEGNGMTYWMKGGSVKPNDGISYEEQALNPDGIYNYYKKLIKIRKENPLLFEGDLKKINIAEGLLAYEVSNGTDKVIVINNCENSKKEIESKILSDISLHEILQKRVEMDGKFIINEKETLIFHQ